MADTVLHYIYDPLCGWCYGAAPLVWAARELPGLTISLHAGGMMSGPHRQQVSEALREYVMPHDRRIASLSGQPFGQAYSDGLLRDRGAVFDSDPPAAAVLVAQGSDGRGLDLLSRIQHAHYVEGRRIADAAVLADLGGELGFERDIFADQLAWTLDGPVQEHVVQSRRLLARVGGHGFPTFALQKQTRLELLDASRWFGNPEGWQAALIQRMA